MSWIMISSLVKVVTLDLCMLNSWALLEEIFSGSSLFWACRLFSSAYWMAIGSRAIELELDIGIGNWNMQFTLICHEQLHRTSYFRSYLEWTTCSYLNYITFLGPSEFTIYTLVAGPIRNCLWYFIFPILFKR